MLSEHTRPRVAVVGAGITGLVAALELAAHCEVVLFEKDDRLGGKLLTGQLSDVPLDLGPDSFITRNPSALGLCQQLGLGDELVAPAGGFAAIFAHNRIRALPDGLAIGVPTRWRPLLRSRVLSTSGAIRAGLDYLWPGAALASEPVALAERGGPDPTVAEVIGTRLGRGVLYGLVDPLVGGINASDVDALSFSAALPSLARQAGGKRSLMRALRQPPVAGEAVTTPPFLGLERGMSSLVARLASACRAAGVQIHAGTPIDVLRVGASAPAKSRWSLQGTGITDAFDGVVLALPAGAACGLLELVDEQLARECRAIAYSGVVTIGLAWPEGVVGERARRALAGVAAARSVRPEETSGPSPSLLGNGLLVTRSRQQLITAATFTSTKWPRRQADGQLVIRASAGRHGDERALQLGDEELLSSVRADLRAILGIEAPPLATLIQRWPASFPQYTSGHLARQVRIDTLLAERPGLALAGAGYRGIGIPACIDSARRAALTVLSAIST